ncbi:MviM Predicted dehydrogenases and related proteins [Rhabdaerophilaceae bacterium]
MTEVFNIAIVGAGIGENQASGLLNLQDRFRISVICDKNIARAEGLADMIVRAGAPRPAIAGEFGPTLLARGDIDIVSICLPPFLHFDAVRQALEAGKHVVCEKPLVGSLAQVDALDALALNHGKTLMPVFQYRFGNGMLKAKHLLESGAAGKVYLASLETHWTRKADYYDVAWRGKMATELGGVFLGHAIHIHDMLTHLVGEVRSVSALTRVRVNPIETEDCAGALFDMADGSIAVSSASLGSADEISRLRLMCENVTMISNLSPYAPHCDPWTFLPKSPRDDTFLGDALASAPSASEGYAEQFARYHQALVSGSALPITVADARRSIALASAIYHSARTGEQVTLPLPKGHPTWNGWN